jgi:hypothetical protein
MLRSRYGQLTGASQSQLACPRLQRPIEEDSFHYERKTANVEREQNLDGIYVIRTSVKPEVLSSQEVVASYKSLSGVERAFRSLKTVDLQARRLHSAACANTRPTFLRRKGAAPGMHRHHRSPSPIFPTKHLQRSIEV